MSDISVFDSHVLVSNAYSILDFVAACENVYSFSPLSLDTDYNLTACLQRVDDCGDRSDEAIVRLDKALDAAFEECFAALERDRTDRLAVLFHEAFGGRPDPDPDPDPDFDVLDLDEIGNDYDLYVEHGGTKSYGEYVQAEKALLDGEAEVADLECELSELYHAGCMSDEEHEELESVLDGAETEPEIRDAVARELHRISRRLIPDFDKSDSWTVDEETRWAIENDCCAVFAPLPFGGHVEIRLSNKSVNDGTEVGLLVSYGLEDAARDVIALALEKADALMIWGDCTLGYNTYEAPVGVAKTVDEAISILRANTGVTGWEML